MFGLVVVSFLIVLLHRTTQTGIWSDWMGNKRRHFGYLKACAATESSEDTKGSSRRRGFLTVLSVNGSIFEVRQSGNLDILATICSTLSSQSMEATVMAERSPHFLRSIASEDPSLWDHDSSCRQFGSEFVFGQERAGESKK